MITGTPRERLIAHLETRVKQAQDAIDQFKKKLDNGAAYAFEWSQSAFEAAAIIEVATPALEYLRGDAAATVDLVKESWTREALQRARSPEFSTSVTSNLMSTYRTAALAKLLDDLAWRAL